MNRRIQTILPALLLPLLLCACPRSEQAAPQPADATPPAAQPAATGASDTSDDPMLAGYHWTLESATDPQGKRIDALFPDPEHVLTLNFEAGNAGVTGGCNRMGGDYRIDEQGRLTISSLRATMMACDAALMAADEAIGKLLAQPQQARVEESAPPRLRLVSASGDNTRWIGRASAETRDGGAGERVFLEIAPQRVACSHPLIPDHQCLHVREIRYGDNGVKQSPPGEWQLLYEDIEGFTFVEGERKVLRLKKFARDPAPADASSIVYVLDMVVESEVVPADEAK